MGEQGLRSSYLSSLDRELSLRSRAVSYFGSADANDTAVDPQAARCAGQAKQSAGDDGMPAKAGRLHARLHDDAEEAELGLAESGARPAHQRFRGHELYPWRRP